MRATAGSPDGGCNCSKAQAVSRSCRIVFPPAADSHAPFFWETSLAGVAPGPLLTIRFAARRLFVPFRARAQTTFLRHRPQSYGRALIEVRSDYVTNRACVYRGDVLVRTAPARARDWKAFSAFPASQFRPSTACPQAAGSPVRSSIRNRRSRQHAAHASTPSQSMRPCPSTGLGYVCVRIYAVLPQQGPEPFDFLVLIRQSAPDCLQLELQVRDRPVAGLYRRMARRASAPYSVCSTAL